LGCRGGASTEGPREEEPPEVVPWEASVLFNVCVAREGLAQGPPVPPPPQSTRLTFAGGLGCLWCRARHLLTKICSANAPRRSLSESIKKLVHVRYPRHPESNYEH